VSRSDTDYTKSMGQYLIGVDYNRVKYLTISDQQILKPGLCMQTEFQAWAHEIFIFRTEKI